MRQVERDIRTLRLHFRRASSRGGAGDQAAVTAAAAANGKPSRRRPRRARHRRRGGPLRALGGVLRVLFRRRHRENASEELESAAAAVATGRAETVRTRPEATATSGAATSGAATSGAATCGTAPAASSNPLPNPPPNPPPNPTGRTSFNLTFQSNVRAVRHPRGDAGTTASARADAGTNANAAAGDRAPEVFQQAMGALLNHIQGGGDGRAGIRMRLVPDGNGGLTLRAGVAPASGPEATSTASATTAPFAPPAPAPFAPPRSAPFLLPSGSSLLPLLPLRERLDGDARSSSTRVWPLHAPRYGTDSSRVFFVVVIRKTRRGARNPRPVETIRIASHPTPRRRRGGAAEMRGVSRARSPESHLRAVQIPGEEHRGEERRRHGYEEVEVDGLEWEERGVEEHDSVDRPGRAERGGVRRYSDEPPPRAQRRPADWRMVPSVRPRRRRRRAFRSRRHHATCAIDAATPPRGRGSGGTSAPSDARCFVRNNTGRSCSTRSVRNRNG